MVMTKDSDFLNRLERHGPPPKVIWVTCGNTSNRRMRHILERTLETALNVLDEEPVVDIGDP